MGRKTPKQWRSPYGKGHESKMRQNDPNGRIYARRLVAKSKKRKTKKRKVFYNKMAFYMKLLFIATIVYFVVMIYVFGI